SNAEDCINNAFDGCKSFVKFTDGTDAVTCAPSITNTTPCSVTLARPIGESVATTSNLRVTAYPNPFGSMVKFTIQSSVSGNAQLEVYNQLGQKVSTIYRGYLQANRSQVVEYKAPQLGSQLIYILRVGGQSVTGKLMHLE
ncbi:MAG TPA: T9SS type A sorting domain-containing protein, partial [Chitinophagaceae bacterium]|nr:T9SS type A sorting domain-containing protein [Chitinophagaceae bacterium]